MKNENTENYDNLRLVKDMEEGMSDQRIKELFSNLNEPMSDERKMYIFDYSHFVIKGIYSKGDGGCNDLYFKYTNNIYLPKNLIIKYDYDTDKIYFGKEAFLKDVFSDKAILDKPGILTFINPKNKKRYIIEGESVLNLITEDLISLYDIYEPKHVCKALEEDVKKETVWDFVLISETEDIYKDPIIRLKKVEELKKENKNNLYN